MQARPVFQNQIVFVTRCIDGQRFRLIPSAERNEIIEYLLAVLLRRHEMQLIAITVMSTHYHGIFFDPLGNVPKFTAEFHANLARVLNWADGRTEGGRLWDGRQTNQLNLNSNEVVLDKIAYVMANPVEAGAVKEGRNWPGVRHCWPTRPKVVRRPQFFADDGSLEPRRPKGHRSRRPTVAAVMKLQSHWDEERVRFPSYSVLESHPPPGFELAQEQLAGAIRRHVRAKEEQVRTDRARAGLNSYLGARACRQIPLDSSPRERRELFTMIPSVVGEDRQAREVELKKLREWRAAYREARERYISGEHQVTFPLGTYFMRHRCGVNTELADSI